MLSERRAQSRSREVMAHRDLIVIGASMGGPQELSRLVTGLPKDLRASMLIVQHTSPDYGAYLPPILQRATSWPTHSAEEGEIPQPGHIYVAVPDRHLMLEGKRLRLSKRPPRESFASIGRRTLPVGGILCRSPCDRHRADRDAR